MATKAEGLANTDARTACVYTRRALELAVAWVYKHDKGLRLPCQRHPSALIHDPSFKATAEDAVFTKAKLIKDLGNLAVHSTRPVLRPDAQTAHQSSTLEAVHDTAKGLHRAGVMDQITLREFDQLCLPPIEPQAPEEIKHIREVSRVSQAVLARLLNTSLSTVQK